MAMIVAIVVATRWLHAKMALDCPACLSPQQLDLLGWPRLLGPQTSCRWTLSTFWLTLLFVCMTLLLFTCLTILLSLCLTSDWPCVWPSWQLINPYDNSLTLLTAVWPSWQLFDPLDSCLTPLAAVWPSWQLFDPLDSCLTLLTAIWPSWQLFDPLDSYLTLLTAVWPSWQLFDPLAGPD